MEIRRAPEGILGTPLLTNQWMQASLPISKGRMGLRSTRNHSLAAYLAYLGASQPLVAEMRGGIVDDKQSMAQEEGVKEGEKEGVSLEEEGEEQNIATGEGVQGDDINHSYCPPTQSSVFSGS